MNILLLKGFNNYFNRIVKKYSTLDDYKSHSTSYLEFTNINFNPNDGVATSLVVGGPTQTEGDQVLYWEYNGAPDYLIAYETGDNENLIRSRWFVLESVRTTTGQYQLALKRDVLADHFNEILDAPCYVEKGFVNNVDNTLLYNSENVSYNQIKKDEILLQDTTESGWIVGYTSKNFTNTSTLAPVTISADDADPVNYIDEEDLPFSVDPSATTTVIEADAHKTDLNIIIPMAWVDARSTGWGTTLHQRKQSFELFSNTTLEPYMIRDGQLNTATIEANSVTAQQFLNGGYIGTDPVPWDSMSDSFAIQKVIDGDYVETTTPINTYLTLNINMRNIASDPTKISLVSKKYAAYPDSISGGTFGNIPKSYYVDYQKVIGNKAYSQMKTYYSSNYNWSNLMSYYNSQLATDLANYNAFIRTSDYVSLLSYNEKIVKIGTKYYKMFINFANSYHVLIHNTSTSRMPTYTVNGNNTIQVDTDASSTSNNYMNNIINSFANGVKDDQGNNLFVGQTSWKSGAGVIEIMPKYFVNLEEVSSEDVMTGTTSETFSQAQYTQGATYDAAYNMFAIPYGRLAFKCAGGSNTYYTSKSEGIGIARWLATALGTNLFDLQILPYCPSQNIRDYMADSDILDLSAISGQYQVVYRAPSGTSVSSTTSWSPCSFIFTALSCKGTFDINKQIDVPTEFGSNALNAKIVNETQLVRLCSPNWGSMFEFSLAKNKGVSKFNVDYTYKPYQPYIHMNPDFKGLYGEDWDDSRGLILGGDFSVQSSESAWIDYINNNKNYQAIFNRQIDNLDVTNKIAMEQQDFSNMGSILNMVAAPFSVSGLASAVKTGITNPLMTDLGAIKETDWLRRSQEETKDYTRDMYNFNLRNIQARPNSLARTEALNNNNKIWPIVEIYDCTDVEKQNLINKIRYNGMTIMALGSLADYSYSTDFIQVYVKGQLIRLENINDDFHVVDAIYQEVNKGFFVVQGE